MTLSSLTGALLRSPGGVTRARTPVELTTRAAGLPSAPPVKLPSVPWLNSPIGISVVGAAARLVVGKAVEASLIAGVALAQLGGTDNLPTDCALPRAADAALAPRPGAKCPAEDSPPLSDPNPIPWLHGW